MLAPELPWSAPPSPPPLGRAAWIRALRNNQPLPPVALDELGQSEGGDESGDSSPSGKSPGRKATAGGARKRGVRGLALRAEAYMVSRAVTSDLGKKLLREFCIPETFTLLDSLRELASRDAAMPPKTGLQMENTILRTAVKLVLLIQHNILRPRQFDTVTALADAACIDLVRKYDAVQAPPHRDDKDPEHGSFAAQIQRLEAELIKVVEPQLSAKSLSLLRNVTGYFGAAGTIERFTTEPHFADDLRSLAELLRAMYGLADVLEGGFRRVTVGKPGYFKVSTTAMAPGAAVVCKLPCCDMVVRLTVPRRTRSLIFPAPLQCVAICKGKLWREDTDTPEEAADPAPDTPAPVETADSTSPRPEAVPPPPDPPAAPSACSGSGAASAPAPERKTTESDALREALFAPLSPVHKGFRSPSLKSFASDESIVGGSPTCPNGAGEAYSGRRTSGVSHAAHYVTVDL